MSRFSQSRFLEETLALLVAHFGAESVRAALARIAPIEPQIEQDKSQRVEAPREALPQKHTFDGALELLKDVDPAKYDLLRDFSSKLRARQVLVDSEDIRQFAQLAGLKDLPHRDRGRRDLVPAVLKLLLDLPTDKLRSVLERVGEISEETRRQGFSVLTDKLVKDR